MAACPPLPARWDAVDGAAGQDDFLPEPVERLVRQHAVPRPPAMNGGNSHPSMSTHRLLRFRVRPGGRRRWGRVRGRTVRPGDSGERQTASATIADRATVERAAAEMLTADCAADRSPGASRRIPGSTVQTLAHEYRDREGRRPRRGPSVHHPLPREGRRRQGRRIDPGGPRQDAGPRNDIAFMSAVGMPGGGARRGKSITAAMDKAGLRPGSSRGAAHRRPDARDRRAHPGARGHRELVEDLTDAARAIGLHSLGSCVSSPSGCTSRVRAEKDRPRAGRHRHRGEHDPAQRLCEDRFILVIAPVAIATVRRSAGGSRQRSPNSTSTPTRRRGVAAALKAEKLIVCSDTHGIRTDPKNPTHTPRRSHAATSTR